MNPVSEEIYKAVMERDAYLQHYGTPRHSGRYPWGSGKEPFQHSGDFLSRVDELKKNGLSETEVAQAIGLTTTQLRIQMTMANTERREESYSRARQLRDEGMSYPAIAKEMGFSSESSVRSLLDEHSKGRMMRAKATHDVLKNAVDEKGMIEVGLGVERELGVSKEKLKEVLYMMELEGYPVYRANVPQATNPGKYTKMTVLCKPGTEYKDIYTDGFANVHYINDVDKVSYDGGDTFQKKGFVYPSSLDSKRLMIKYAEEGGIDKDGVIEVRRGAPDLSLGNSNYAQVRVMVDGTHYLKGMAVYADDLPPGIDVRFNTNKKTGTPLEKVLKPIKEDPRNPFGALIKEKGGQSYFDDPVTGEKKLSLINKTRTEGDWGEWADHLSSQFLSKQPIALASKQLGLSKSDKENEYKEIMAVTNPTVRKALLRSYADDCDAAAVYLKAAALPRQKYQVILPLTSISSTEVYAPNYNDGEKVALIRYPHGGTFEIPILTVNNRNHEGRKVLGVNPLDAIGINHEVADRLSGADFDGDTVMVIPTNDKVHIKATNPLKDLEGFDPKLRYGADDVRKGPDGKEHYYRNGKEYKIMKNTQTEMGMVSNLITDMTLRGAPPKELAAAVRHSMVVIDAEKHKLDYHQSAIDNDIKSLKNHYQGVVDDDGKLRTPAGTLISRAKSREVVLKRQGSPKINDPKKPWYDPSRPDGALLYNSVVEEYTVQKKKLDADGNPVLNKNGKPVYETVYNKDGTPKTGIRTQNSTKMAETDDARKLISTADTAVERIYADYANSMKHMANEARMEITRTKDIPYSASAKKTYSEEADHLLAQVHIAELNAPKERRAQIIANSIVTAKVQEFPELMDSQCKKQLRKVKAQALEDARIRTGAERKTIKISDKEWEAIQAGAITKTTLEKIMKYADMESLKEKAMPRQMQSLSDAKIRKIQSMVANDRSTSEIAQALGVSTSTVAKYLKGEE